MGRVLVVGSFNVDHVWHCTALPPPGATLAGRYHTGPGGKGFNQAVAARRAGADTTFVCALGEDAGGMLARGLASDDGIGLRARSCDAPTGTAGIFVDAQGRNSIVIGAGANAALDAAHVEAQAQAIADADVLLAQLESPAPAIITALRLARDAGVRTVLNPAPANARCSAALLALADVITPNETEFAALLASHTDRVIEAPDVAGCDDATLHRRCRALHGRGSVVITLGAAGSFVSHPAEDSRGDEHPYYRVSAAPASAVDTTGAGDAFNGAFCASWAAHPGESLARHLQFASRYAALATQVEGAASAMPHLPA